MKRKIAAGTTSFIDRVFIRDTSQTSKVAGLTGLTCSSSGLTLYYCRAGANSATAVSLVAGMLGAYTNSGGAGTGGGFVAVDGTSMPGWYEVSIPNAAIASGTTSVGLHMRGAANMEDIPWQYELDAVNYQDGVHFGLSSLPNAQAAASGGLLTYGTGAGQINVDGAGNVRVLGSIKRNAQLSNFPFYLVLSSDHVTGATAKTVTATRDIYDGNGFVACANSPTEDANGWYKISLAASDLNAPAIALRLTASGCDSVNITLVTTP